MLRGGVTQRNAMDAFEAESSGGPRVVGGRVDG